MVTEVSSADATSVTRGQKSTGQGTALKFCCLQCPLASISPFQGH